MKRYIQLIAICFLISVVTSAAQNAWTLRQCIDYAVENNIEIKQQELSVEDSELDLNTSKNSRLPDVRASVGQGFSFGQSTVRTADPSDPDKYIDILQDTRTSNTSFGASSGMTLFSGKRISNQIKSSELDLKAAVENLAKAKENLELQVTSLYLDVLFKNEIERIYRKEVELTETQVERTAVLVENGKVPKSQLYEIKAQLANNKLSLTNAESDLQLSILNLTQALNIQEHYGFSVVEPSSDDKLLNNLSLVYSPIDIYNMAVDIKPHIKEAQYRLEGSKYALSVEKGAYWPTLSLSLGYNNGFVHVFGEDNEPIGRQLRKRSNQSIGFNLSIPIFNRLATRNRVRSAQNAVYSRELQLESVKQDIYKEIQQAHQSATSAQARFQSTMLALEAAEESFYYTQERYNVGKATTYELNESQTKLISARSEQVQSKYEFLFRNKILDFYRGIEIDIEY